LKITDIKITTLPLTLHRPVVLTFGTIKKSQSVVVKVETNTGIYGIGEAAPFGPVTGETTETVLTVLKLLKNHLIGQDPLALQRINHTLKGAIALNTSAKAAIDIALYDIYSKVLDVPLYVALGGESDKVETDITLWIAPVNEMLKEIEKYLKEGFKIFKLKAGIDSKRDIELVKSIRENFGEELILRMDANQGWNLTEAIDTINTLGEYKIELIEQPIPLWDIEGLKRIREKVRVPLMADESLFTPEDAIRLVRENAVDLFNIKLMKSGGLFDGTRINTIGEAAGIQCMVGCMMESPISITAAAHFVAANKNITRCDLDSTFHSSQDRVTGGADFKGGMITLPDTPGIGVDIDI